MAYSCPSINTVARIEDKLGQHASDTAQILFESCRIPAANLLGDEGQGLKIALSGLEGGRIGIASPPAPCCRHARASVGNVKVGTTSRPA